MNKTAMRNKELAQEAHLAAAERLNRKEIADKDRNLKAAVEREKLAENKRQCEKSKFLNAAKALLGGVSSGLGLGNDPSWYKTYPDSDAIANLTGFLPLGTETRAVTRDSNGTNYKRAGIVAYYYVDTIGTQDPNTPYASQPFYVALSNFYAEMRKLNSRVGDYEIPEIGMYLYTSVSLIARICSLALCIKAAITYSANNRYIGKSIIMAKTGLSASEVDKLIDNRIIYMDRLNLLISRFNSTIPVPGALTLAARKIWMNSFVWADSSNKQSQMYLFRPKFYFKFDDTNNEAQQVAEVTSSLDNLFSSVEAQLSDLVDSPVLLTMMADFRAAFPEDKCITIPTVQPTDTLEVVTSDEVLSQFQNAMTLPDGVALTSGNLRTNATGFLVQGTDPANAQGGAYVLSVSGRSGPELNGWLNIASSSQTTESPVQSGLNFYSDEITNDDILVATRLRHTYRWGTFDSTAYNLVDLCGTEVVQNLFITCYSGTGVSTIPVYNMYTELPTEVLANATGVGRSLIAVGTLVQFDWAPYVSIWVSPLNPSGGVVSSLSFMEWGRRFPLANDNLAALHRRCVMSEVFVPSSIFSRR